MRANLRRRTIALVTAYAVAIQALLPALALVIGPSGDQLRTSVELCTNADVSGGLPGHHHNGCAHGLSCLMAGCAGMAAALAPETVQFRLDFSAAAVLALEPLDSIASPTGLAHSARAPPHA